MAVSLFLLVLCLLIIWTNFKLMLKKNCLKKKNRLHCISHSWSSDKIKLVVVVLVTQSCTTLCDPMDPLWSSVHGILQARILEWVAIPFSRGSSLTQGSNPGLLHCWQVLHCLGLRDQIKKIPMDMTFPNKYNKLTDNTVDSFLILLNL